MEESTEEAINTSHLKQYKITNDRNNFPLSVYRLRGNSTLSVPYFSRQNAQGRVIQSSQVASLQWRQSFAIETKTVQRGLSINSGKKLAKRIGKENKNRKIDGALGVL